MRICRYIIVYRPYLIIWTITLIGNIIGINAYHEYPSAKRLEKEDKRCEILLENQTTEKCGKRLEHCCKSAKRLMNKPVCATTRYGIGMIFFNPCSLHYIRCLYPEICFLKRDLSHQHCRRYQVMTENHPPDIPCHSFTTASRSSTTTTIPLQTLPYQHDQGDETGKGRPAPRTEKSPLLKTLKTLPPNSDTSPRDKLLSTTKHFLPPSRSPPTSPMPFNLIASTTMSPVLNSTTTSSVATTEPLTIGDTSSDITLTQMPLVTPFIPTTTISSECIETPKNVALAVSVIDAMFMMNKANSRTTESEKDKAPHRKSYQLINNCATPPPTFPFCSFPTVRERS